MPLMVPRPPCWTATTALAARSTSCAPAADSASRGLFESVMRISRCACADMTPAAECIYWPDGRDEWRSRRYAARQVSRATIVARALMQAMQLTQPRIPLAFVSFPDPTPGAGEVRVRVAACGVCRTDLHVVDGELPHPRLPLIPGHEIVGRVEALGRGATRLRPGDRVGVPW